MARARAASSSAMGVAVEQAKTALARAEAVCFDVDSTVIQDEGIDVLAEHCGAGRAVAELTAKYDIHAYTYIHVYIHIYIVMKSMSI
jgi:hypothetical protein